MKSIINYLILLLFIFTCIQIFAQEASTDSLHTEGEVFTIVDEMPIFPGGEEALFKYLSNNLNYPQYEKENHYSGTLYVNFVVKSDGRIGNVQVIKEIPGAPGFTKEALRIISAMPNWEPGKQGGTPVPVQYNIPLKWTVKSPPLQWLVIMKEGSSLLDQGKYMAAIIKFNKALKLSPNQPEILFERAAASLNSGDKQGACDDWYTIIEHTGIESYLKEAQSFYSEYCRKEDNSNVQEVFQVREDEKNIKEGEYKQYFQQMLLCEGQYLNNYKSNNWTYYHNGKVMIKGSYVKDKKNGTWAYFRNNKLVSNHFYSNSIKDSIYVYYENGNIHSKIRYAEKDSTSEAYYINGNIKEQRYWVGGNKNVKIYFSNGSLHRHLILKDEIPYNDLLLTDFSGNSVENGKIINGKGIFINYEIDTLDQLIPSLTCELKDCLPEGIYQSYYRRKKTSEGICKAGYKIGRWEELNYNGTLKVTEYKESDKEKVVLKLKSDKEYGDLVKVEHMPLFPGDEEALFKYLSSSIKYPQGAKDRMRMGTVFITFTIDAEGKVINSKVLKGVDPLLDAEAERVINLMPNWIPGLHSGIPVNVQYNLPVKFIIN